MRKYKAIIVTFLLLFTGGFLQVSAAEPLIFLNDAENPATIDQILHELMANDDIDGDLSSVIEVSLDNYSENKSVVGDFLIVFEVTDSGNQTVQYPVIIRNKDLSTPVFTLEVESSLNIPQYSVLSAHLPRITAYDGLDGDLTADIIINGLANIDTSILGSHVLTYTVYDHSGNKAEEIYTIHIVDGEAPEIKGPSKIYKRKDVILQSDFYLSYFSATDNIDGIVSNRIEVIRDEYIGNADNPGIYEVEVRCTDEQGNISFHTFEIEVVKDMLPRLIVDKYHWVVDNDSQFDSDAFTDTLILIDDIPNYSYIFTVNYDNYTQNFERIGTFQVDFNLRSSSGNEYDRVITMKIQEAELNVIQENPSWIAENWKVVGGAVAIIMLVGLAIYGATKN